MAASFISTNYVIVLGNAPLCSSQEQFKLVRQVCVAICGKRSWNRERHRPLDRRRRQNQAPRPDSVVKEDQYTYVALSASTRAIIERSHLTLRQSCKRFARLGNGFSKQLENHCAAISLYVMHYNFCRVHESVRSTPAMALGIADRVWMIGDLVDAALATQPITPKVTPPDRRRRFTEIDGGKAD